MAEFWRSVDVPGLESRRSCQHNTCYRPHTHGAFSIGLIDEGSYLFSGRLDGTIHLEPGDVVLIPSGQVRACNPDRGRWDYQMIQGMSAARKESMTHANLTGLVAALLRLCYPELIDLLPVWASAAKSVAAEVAAVAGGPIDDEAGAIDADGTDRERDRLAEQVVVGTILVGKILAALRLLAQIDAATGENRAE